MGRDDNRRTRKMTRRRNQLKKKLRIARQASERKAAPTASKKK